jgi:hypothetical protein
MCKNSVELDRPQTTNWRTRIACWVTMATYTRWKHVILIAFPLQQLLHEHALVLPYTYIARLVSLKIVVDSVAVPRNLSCFSSHVVSFFLLCTVLTNTKQFAVFCNNSMSCVRPLLFVFLLRIMAYSYARNYAICTFGLLVTVVKEVVVWGRSEITEWTVEGCVAWRTVLVYKMFGEVEVAEKYWRRIIILFMDLWSFRCIVQNKTISVLCTCWI